jgi:hypothetical protein
MLILVMQVALTDILKRAEERSSAVQRCHGLRSNVLAGDGFFCKQNPSILFA